MRLAAERKRLVAPSHKIEIIVTDPRWPARSFDRWVEEIHAHGGQRATSEIDRTGAVHFSFTIEADNGQHALALACALAAAVFGDLRPQVIAT